MTTDAARPTPRTRFLVSLIRWVRAWLICILGGLVLTGAGIFPTAISVVALMGVVWVPIVVLTLWGRMLDEVMHPRSDLEEGCR
ncbi:MAG: hypothetical protein OEN23_17010 [Paracoccaceae bacterium]|nr:hypothetical protein [Paracoccaceae bacterium]